MKTSAYLNELSKCVRCGSCKAFCPTYDEDTSEAMSARGRLALLWGLSSGHLNFSPVLNERIFSCILCGRCESLCPLEVPIKEVIYHGRTLLKKSDKKRNHIRFFTKLFTKNPKLSLRLLGLTQHIVFPYLLRKGFLSFRPELPGRHLKDRLRVFTSPKKKGRVAVFAGCAVTFLYPHLGDALINILHKLSYEVVFLTGEMCCGSPLRVLGLEKEAVELAKKNVSLFKRLNVEAVLTLCPTCALTIKTEYPKLIGEGIEKAMDISSFFFDKIDSLQLISPAPNINKAIYHDPCHLKYGLGIEREPREIINKIGIDLLKMEDQRCCGFAGTFSLSFRDLSQGLLNRCLNAYSDGRAEIIITSCPGCMLQLAKVFRDKPVIHLIELIEEAMFPQ